MEERDDRENSIKGWLMLANILSLFQVYNSLVICQLRMTWMKTQRVIHLDENLFTTGLYKDFVFQCLCILVQPYWFLQGSTFKDSYNENTKDLDFEVNDALTVL